MDASELARHLLATGLNPREPRSKRKQTADAKTGERASRQKASTGTSA